MVVPSGLELLQQRPDGGVPDWRLHSPRLEHGFFVRLPAVLLSIGTGILVYRLGRELFDSSRVGFLAVLACSANPLYAAGSILMTIDAPLVFLWTLAVYCTWNAARSNVSGAPQRWWLAFAVALGLGVLSKYTMVLILPCVCGYLFLSPRARPWLTRREPALALLFAGILCTPIFIWNAAHDWVSLRHLMGLAGLASTAAEAEAHFTGKTFVEFIASQLGVVSPVLCIASVRALVVSGRLGFRQKRDEHLLVFLFAAVPLGFFLLWSVYEKVEGNWAAPAYVTAMIGVAALWDGSVLPRTTLRAAVSRIALVLLPGFFMAALAYFPSLPRYIGMRLPANVDLTRRLDGWRELGMAVGRMRKESNVDDIFLASDQYQIASELAFYVPGQPEVYNLNAGRRMNQYDIWDNLDVLRNRDGLFVTYGDRPPPPLVQQACETLHRVGVVQTSHLGQPGQIFSVFRCVRYKGVPAMRNQVTY